MRWLPWLMLVALTGCASQGITSSTPVDMVNAINQNKSSNCISVTAGPYSVNMAKLGEAGSEVNMTGASCTIKGLAAPTIQGAR